MKILGVIIFVFFNFTVWPASAGTWSDNFDEPVLNPQWRGDRSNFELQDGCLRGFNANPIIVIPMKMIEVGDGWSDYTVQCRINVVTPNLMVCSKGALILRHSGQKGYIFALHVATRTVEVYRLPGVETLLSKEEPLELKTWYRVRAELQGERFSFYLNDELIGQITDKESPSGAVGLGVEDALSVLFDDFSVTGVRVPAEICAIGKLPVIWARIKTREP